MRGITVITAAIAALLMLGGVAAADRADSRMFARRGADDVAEGGHRGEHHREKGDAALAADVQNGKGKALFEAKCSACHDLGRALRQTKDRGGWTATVKRMQQVNGCRITDTEATEIIDYLITIRGKGP